MLQGTTPLANRRFESASPKSGLELGHAAHPLLGFRSKRCFSALREPRNAPVRQIGVLDAVVTGFRSLTS